MKDDDPFPSGAEQWLGHAILGFMRKYAWTGFVGLVTLGGTFSTSYVAHMNQRIADAEEKAVAAKNAVELSQQLFAIQIQNLQERMSRNEAAIDRRNP